ncbi:hypothetical protein H7K33_00280 [Mycobacterium paraense]|uniref:hypothetical protein n=1 Tax=Mycobacterium paraense TaxID=767916 RepID=UPI00146E76B8|nr:hypothetical protein [Mycobacterium paraense]MCV7440655.1 hypothetical protein [Mycobacterium paraense]
MIILNVFFDVAQEHEANFLKLLNHMVVESNFNDTVNGYLKSDYDEHHYEEIPR